MQIASGLQTKMIRSSASKFSVGPPWLFRQSFWEHMWDQQWVTKCTAYELTSQRLRIRTGILNKKVDELELFRVKDYSMEQPFLLRLVGLGNLTMVTSDATTPTVSIRAISGVEAVREKLRNAVQAERDRRRVRELDVDGSSESLS
jgi:uncharacterized membrane protein YdbT with pleckstrin-like domain